MNETKNGSLTASYPLGGYTLRVTDPNLAMELNELSKSFGVGVIKKLGAIAVDRVLRRLKNGTNP